MASTYRNMIKNNKIVNTAKSEGGLTSISTKVNSEFLDRFKMTCDEIGVSQSDFIRSALLKLIIDLESHNCDRRYYEKILSEINYSEVITI